MASRCDSRAAFQAPVWDDLPSFETVAILLFPIHSVYGAARAGTLGGLCASEVFETVDARRKCSFKEVTDETRGTGQRKFARWWYRAAEPNFSPQRHRGSGRSDPAAEGAFVSSPHAQDWEIT